MLRYNAPTKNSHQKLRYKAKAPLLSSHQKLSHTKLQHRFRIPLRPLRPSASIVPILVFTQVGKLLLPISISVNPPFPRYSHTLSHHSFHSTRKYHIEYQCESYSLFSILLRPSRVSSLGSMVLNPVILTQQLKFVYEDWCTRELITRKESVDLSLRNGVDSCSWVAWMAGNPLIARESSGLAQGLPFTRASRALDFVAVSYWTRCSGSWF